MMTSPRSKRQPPPPLLRLAAVVAAAAGGAAALPNCPNPASDHGPPIGMNFALTPPNGMDGVAFVRLWDNSPACTWLNIQPTAATWDWSCLDTLLNGVAPTSAAVLYVIGGTPPWAAAIAVKPTDPAGALGPGSNAVPTVQARVVPGCSTRVQY